MGTITDMVYWFSYGTLRNWEMVTQTPPWQIDVLGGLRISYQGNELKRFRSARSALLLAYLVCAPGRRYSRSELTELLWTDEDLDVLSDPSNSLRAVLHGLTAPLKDLAASMNAPALLAVDRSGIQLQHAVCQIDRDRLQASILQARRATIEGQRVEAMRQAVEHYSGPLLDGYEAEWIAPYRVSLSEDYHEMLIGLIQHLVDMGKPSLAMRHLHQGVTVMPLDEGLRRRLMRLQVSCGNVAGAVQQYYDLERRLRRELSIAPTPATEELFHRIADSSARSSVGSSPPRPSVAQVPPALEPSLTRFFGREAEIRELLRILRNDGPRLVTLTGFGGVGKTRLALELTARLSLGRAESIWYVSLQNLADPGLLARTLARSLSLSPGSEEEALEQLVLRMNGQAALLVLDNFEHLVPEGVQLLRSLLAQAPGLTILVTSRIRLNVRGEQEYPVAPLSVPDISACEARADDLDMGMQGMQAMPSVALFLDRARLVRPGFAFTQSNRRTIIQICRHLEGIPLAIELAAAWVRLLKPETILDRLEDRFGMLVSRDSDRPKRHQTMWEVVAGSVHLLSPEDHRYFSCLSVFRGSWSLEAAQVVCGGASGEVRERVESLVRHSLVQVEEGEEAFRYRLLEMLRDFAAVQLTADERTISARRHAEYFLELAQVATIHLHGPEQGVWLQRLSPDLDNFRTAMDFYSTPSLFAHGLALAVALGPFWDMRGFSGEGYQQTTTLLGFRGGSAALVIPVRLCVRALGTSGSLAFNKGDPDGSLSSYEEQLSLAEGTLDDEGVADAHSGIGLVLWVKGHYLAATKHHTIGLELYRKLGDGPGVARALNNLGNIDYRRGDLMAARRHHEESLALRRRQGNPQTTAFSLYNLGEVSKHEMDYPAAKACYQEGLSVAEPLQDLQFRAYTLHNLGQIARIEGNPAEARASLSQSVALFRTVVDRHGLAVARNSEAWLHLDCGAIRQAEAGFLEALGLRAMIGHRRGIAECLEGIAALAAVRLDAGRAIRLIGAAEELRGNIGVPLPAFERADRDRYVAAVQDNLKGAAFEAALREGAALVADLPAAVAYAVAYVGG